MAVLWNLVLVAGCAAATVRPEGPKSPSPKYFEELEHFWSYGRSPPVYPSPESSGLGDWAHAYQKAKFIVATLSNEEKANLTTGFDTAINGCSGKGGSIPRIGYSGFCLSDAENGLRGTEGTNAYPAAIHVGASWNRALAYDRALYMGAEFKRKGSNVILGPSVGPLGRVPKGGRNWEGFSNDPYLASQINKETILGYQKSVVACVKHLVGNEQETNRKSPRLNLPTHNASASANIDDRTMHELYLWPFQDAVRAGVGSVMCSYNRVNNSDACQNSKVLNGLLKSELAFQGFVVSDWDEQKSGVASANAGMDMVMPVAKYWNNGNLTNMVKNGTVTQSRLDDMAIRALAAWLKYGDFRGLGKGIPANTTVPHKFVNGRDPLAKSTIFQGAVEGHVLVKNINKTLPLRKPQFLSIFGYDAVAQAKNSPDNTFFSLYTFGLEAARNYLNGSSFTPNKLFNLFDVGFPTTDNAPEIALNGTLISGGGSGSTTPAYIDAPLDAIQRQAYDDDTYLSWDIHSPEPVVNPASDACLVFINAVSSEGSDRRNLTEPYSDRLIETVAKQCANTIVVTHSDSGRALVELLYGKQSPSGRMPYTVAKKEEDYGHLANPVYPSNETPFYPQAEYTEGLYIDYKHFIKQDITPRFEFGFGLTYTTFEYDWLDIIIDEVATAAELPPRSDVILPGGIDSLWDEVATVTFDVKNTGDVAAAEVAQLYLGIPGGPEKVLRGFEKRVIQPGDVGRFQLRLTRRDISFWDVVHQNWVLQRGTYNVFVGRSVLDTPLVAAFTIE